MVLRVFLVVAVVLGVVACGEDTTIIRKPGNGVDASMMDGSTGGDAAVDASVDSGPGDAGDGGDASVPCTTLPAPKVYLFNVGSVTVADMGGSRKKIDGLADKAVPVGVLPDNATASYKGIGFLSMTGDAIADFPTNHCVPADVPVVGITAAGVETELGTNWADFIDGTIPETIGMALDVSGFNYFWTGSNNDGTASGHDCSGWTTAVGADASISDRSNTTTNWLNGSDNASCGAGYSLLGLALCTANCP